MINRAARRGDARFPGSAAGRRTVASVGTGESPSTPSRGENCDELRATRILVVEDEILLSEEMVEALERAGAEPVGPVTTVEGALRIIAGPGHLDGALINVHLRGALCFPVADALTERRIPFLFVTGDDAFVAEHYPDVPSHPKPSDMPTLLGALGTLVAGTADAARNVPAHDRSLNATSPRPPARRAPASSTATAWPRA